MERKTGNATDHEMKILNGISGQNYAMGAVQSGDRAAVLGPTAGHLQWPQALLGFSS